VVYAKEILDSKIEQAQRDVDRQKVNHILHFLLSIFTAGIWVFIWIIITIISKLEVRRLEENIQGYFQEKIKTANTDIYKVKTDSADKLIKLSGMLEKGLLTEEEFHTEKEKIIKS
jgi:hypothetical protein